MIEYSGITILVRGRSFDVLPIISKNILPFTISIPSKGSKNSLLEKVAGKDLSNIEYNILRLF
jgi:hypothetical protein